MNLRYKHSTNSDMEDFQTMFDDELVTKCQVVVMLKAGQT